MGNTVKRFWPFMWADYKSAEQYLERMAAKGLLLKSIDDFLFSGFGFIAVYEKCEPQRRKYCIDSLTGSRESIEEYAAMAEDAGWTLAAADYGIGVFCSEKDQSPVPLQTDPKNEYRQIRKSFWKMDIPLGLLTLPLIYFVYKLESLPDSGNRNENIYTYIGYLLIFCFFAFALAGLLRAISFYIKSGIAIRRDIPLKPLREGTARMWGALHGLTGICIALFMMGRLMNYLYIGVFSGEAYKMICCLLIAGSLIGTNILARLEITKRNKYVKMLFIGLMILGIGMCFVYCGTGCEITTEN